VEYLLSILEDKNYAMAPRHTNPFKRQQLSTGIAVL
jgi:hypothetical protein